MVTQFDAPSWQGKATVSRRRFRTLLRSFETGRNLLLTCEHSDSGIERNYLLSLSRFQGYTIAADADACRMAVGDRLKFAPTALLLCRLACAAPSSFAFCIKLGNSLTGPPSLFF